MSAVNYNNYLESAYTGTEATEIFQVLAPCKVVMGLYDLSSSVGVFPLYMLNPARTTWVLFPDFTSLSIASNKTSVGDPLPKGYYCFKPSSNETGSVAIFVDGSHVILNPSQVPSASF